jgi:putative tryptophan/tyrosine transport system substrate-binding protein
VTTRRTFIIALGAVATTSPLAAFGQQPQARIARVGFLSYLADPDPALGLLRKGLGELGYVEGRSYVIVARFANGDFTQLPRLVEELAAERVDVIVSRGPSVEFTKSVRSRIPIVFAYSGDPIEAGFGDSLRTPRRNMTGITFMAMELSAKRIEVLKELIPKASRIALLSNPEHSGELSEYRVTEDTARRLGAALTRHLVRNPQELTAAFAAIRADNPDAMIVFPDSLTFERRKEIAAFAAQAKIPCVYGWTEFAEAGGLLSYGPTLTENFKTLAVFVDKILKGGEAGNIPIEQVKSITLTLNLAAAKALALNVPQSIFVRADKVIE